MTTGADSKAAAAAAKLTAATEPEQQVAELLAHEAGRVPDRARLFMALAASIRERGFRGTTVADIVRGAKTSRRMFYRYFADRETCFLALADELKTVVAEHVNATWDPDLTWEQQVDRTIADYFGLVALDPALTVSLIREMSGLGDAGVKHQREDVVMFANVVLRLVDASREVEPMVRPMSRTTAITVAGGMREVIAYSIEQGVPLDEVAPDASELIKSLLRPAEARVSAPSPDPPAEPPVSAPSPELGVPPASDRPATHAAV